MANCTAFEGSRQIASGDVAFVATKVKEVVDRGERAPVLIFDDDSSQLVEIDFRVTVEEVRARLRPVEAAPVEAAPRRPGRPKLGVVAREITLLPRHWEWLATQPGGASVAIRKLVEQARGASQPQDRIRLARESAYRFMSAMAGNEPGFEEATRALFAGKRERFDQETDAWPADVRSHARKLAGAGF
jgi:uncharacterized protein